MKRVAWRFASVLGMALLCSSASSPPSPTAPPERRGISGRYLSTGDSTKTVALKPLASDIYRVVADGWEGVGFLNGGLYWGVFHALPDVSTKLHGTHRGKLQPDGSLAVHGEFPGGGGKPFDVVWTPDRAGAAKGPPRSEPKIVVAPPSDEELPKFGDFVYVDELPEAITKVPPSYPQAAREANVDGTVLVQVLVGKDGRVVDTRVIKSIPGLDEAAATAARQWVFKPAMAGGKPVAVWVAVPVRFTLH
jgi:TonB family protein